MTMPRVARVAALCFFWLVSGCARQRTITPDEAEGLRLCSENIRHPQTALITDAEVQALLDLNVGLDGQADGLVVGVVDEQGRRLLSAGKMGGLPRDYGTQSPAAPTCDELYTFLSHCQLQQEPGSHKSYSNLGMGLLGHAIALRAAQDYETLVIDRICRPLGMDSTRVTLSPELRSRAARGHAFPGR